MDGETYTHAKQSDDRLKFVAAMTMDMHTEVANLLEVWTSSMPVSAVMASESTSRAILAVLQKIWNEVLLPAVRGLPGTFEYSDGTPVATRLPLGPNCACVAVHVWHPEVTHPLNQPRELPPTRCPRGGRHRVTVTARGVLRADDDHRAV